LLLSVIIPLSYLSPLPQVQATTSQLHSPIEIDGNGEFTPENGVTGGAGTSSDPYVIEGWDSAFIFIEGTDAHFSIRNVRTRWLRFTSITNGDVENSVLGFFQVHSSSRIVVASNDISGGDDCGAFCLASATDVRITGNVISSGMFFNDDYVTANVTISNNIIDSILSYALSGPIVVTGNRLGFIEVRGPHWNGLVVHHNNLNGNYFWEVFSGVNVSWDAGYPAGGNYWYGYGGLDQCRGPAQDICTGPDGIRDTPQFVSLGYCGTDSVTDLDIPCPVKSPGDRDRFPLMQPVVTISASLDLDPNVLHGRSNGRYLTAYIEFPSDAYLSNLDPSGFRLNSTISVAAGSPVLLGDHDHDGVPDLMVKFSRQEVKTLFPGPGIHVLQVTGNAIVVGNTIVGRFFAVSDTVRFC